jgi:sulfite exporter TauE/SafE
LATDGAALPVALLVAGLASGFSHCVGMCGPFVLGQVAAGGAPALGWGRRIGLAALVPYHIGRATTYAALGAAAGGLAGAVAWITAFAWLTPLLLALAAALLLAQAFGVGFHGSGGWGRLLGHVAGRLDARRPARRYLTGLLLGLLPCGVLLAAVAAAAGAGDAFAGALAMLAFASGTYPGLFLVGFAGHGLARLAGSGLRYAAVLILLLNAGTLGAIALGAAP